MKKNFAVTKIITVLLVLLIAGISSVIFMSNKNRAYASNVPISIDVNKKLSFEKTFALKNLPPEITRRMKFKIEDGNIVVYGYFPKEYTIKQKKEMFFKINETLKKSSTLFDSKYSITAFYTTSYPFKWKRTYHIGGTKTEPVEKVSFYNVPGEIVNYIDTDATLYNYYVPGLPVARWEKVVIKGFSSAMYLTNNVPSEYTGLHLSAQVHVWGLSVSVSYPPSGNVAENKGVFNADTYAPSTYVVKDWENTPLVRYGILFMRFTQDQYVLFKVNIGNKGFWYSLGKWF